MGKILAPVVAGLGLLLALPATGSARARRPVEGTITFHPVPEESFQKTILVEIQGKLRYVCHPAHPVWQMGGYSTWEITVDGETYALDLGTAPLATLAQHLGGKTVRVKGRLDVFTEAVGRRGPGPKFMDARLVIRKIVRVSHLEEVPSESVKETVTVVVHGKLLMKARAGYPSRSVAMICANGQTFVLDFSNQTLAAEANRLDGRTVVLQGTFAGFRFFPVMGVPHGERFPVLQVSDLKAGQGESVTKTVDVTVRGKLDQAVDPFSNYLDPDEPRYRITVNGVTYGLDLTANPLRMQAVCKLPGRGVLVTGRLELRRTFAGKVWHILVVSDLQVEPGDHVVKTEGVEIHGKLVFVGIPESFDYRGVDCLITVNGKGYWLSFAGNQQLRDLAMKMQNRVVVVTGVLEHRRTVDVVIVHGLKLPPPQLQYALEPRERM
jgi:hypothetical protein